MKLTGLFNDAVDTLVTAASRVDGWTCVCVCVCKNVEYCQKRFTEILTINVTEKIFVFTRH